MLNLVRTDFANRFRAVSCGQQGHSERNLVPENTLKRYVIHSKIFSLHQGMRLIRS